jgi:hypothetical protein
MDQKRIPVEPHDPMMVVSGGFMLIHADARSTVCFYWVCALESL